MPSQEQYPTAQRPTLKLSYLTGGKEYGRFFRLTPDRRSLPASTTAAPHLLYSAPCPYASLPAPHSYFAATYPRRSFRLFRCLEGTPTMNKSVWSTVCSKYACCLTAGNAILSPSFRYMVARVETNDSTEDNLKYSRYDFEMTLIVVESLVRCMLR